LRVVYPFELNSRVELPFKLIQEEASPRSVMATDFFPSAPAKVLRQQYVGKHVSSLPTPSAIVSEAVVRRNCVRMLQVADALSVGFRPHVKTHKVRTPYLSCIFPSTWTRVSAKELEEEEKSECRMKGWKMEDGK
jgi:hypothetical protein